MAAPQLSGLAQRYALSEHVQRIECFESIGIERKIVVLLGEPRGPKRPIDAWEEVVIKDVRLIRRHAHRHRNVRLKARVEPNSPAIGSSWRAHAARDRN